CRFRSGRCRPVAHRPLHRAIRATRRPARLRGKRKPGIGLPKAGKRPVADRERDLPPAEHAEVPRLVERRLLLNTILTAVPNGFLAAILTRLRLLCLAEILCFSQSFALRSRHPGLAKERSGRSLPEEAVSRASCL